MLDACRGGKFAMYSTFHPHFPRILQHQIEWRNEWMKKFTPNFHTVLHSCPFIKSFGSLFHNFTDHYLTRISMLQLWTKPIKHFHYRQQPVSDKESTAPKWQPTPDPPASVRSYMKASSILDTKRYNTIKWTTWYMWWGYQTQKLFSKLNHLCLQIHQH